MHDGRVKEEDVREERWPWLIGELPARDELHELPCTCEITEKNTLRPQ